MTIALTDVKAWQGRMLVSVYNTTARTGEWDFIGDVSDVSIDSTADYETFAESQSGLSLVENRWRTSIALELKWTCNHLSAANLAENLSGTKTDTTSGSVAAEELNGGEALEVGKTYSLARPGATYTNVEITDSSQTPKTLTANTHYVLSAFGSFEILALPQGATAPFKVDYDYSSYTVVTLFDEPPPLRAVRLELINIAQSGARGTVELYKVQFDIAKTFDLLKKSRSKLDMTATILADLAHASTNWLDVFGRAA